MHDTHRKLCIKAISDDRSISAIIIKKSLKEILQISEGMAFCLRFQIIHFNDDTY